MPINDQGYLRITYDEILENRIALAKELFGQDIDTSNASALGKFIRLSAQDLADAFEVQEALYYGRFPRTATGQNLDRLMPFAGITRNPPTKAEHEIKFTGTSNHQIDVGFLVGTTGDETFYLLNTVVLDENGEGVGVVQCTEYGTTGNVPLGAITEIINPDANVLAIEHVGIKTIAEDEETDARLRERFDIAIEGSGSGTAVAIRGAVMRIEGVKDCIVIENEQDTTDAEGRPAHSFETYVYAPKTDDQEIADAVFSKKPLGIKAYGSSSALVTDISGNVVKVGFSRVSEINIHVNITVATDSTFEIDGDNKIKTALLGYINTLPLGEDVVYTALYRHIFGITGVKDVTALSLSTDGATYQSGNVTVGHTMIAVLDAENIAIEVTPYADK